MIKVVMTRKPKKAGKGSRGLINYMLPDLFSSKHLVYKLEVGLNVVVACCLLITPPFFCFFLAELHKGSRWFLFRVLQLILQVSYKQYFWFARDVTAAILVVKSKSISLRRELYSIFMYILPEKKICFIDRQHGRLFNQELQLSHSSSVIREVHFQ